MIAAEHATLVYRDDGGHEHTQPLTDLGEVGTLVDPGTGEDMEIVGVRTSGTIAHYSGTRRVEPAADDAWQERVRAAHQRTADRCDPETLTLRDEPESR